MLDFQNNELVPSNDDKLVVFFLCFSIIMNLWIYADLMYFNTL